MMCHFNWVNYRFKKQHGFSLIELMVVMAIMTVLMALVGGLTSQTVSKRERQVEIEKVAQIFKRLSYQAYYSGYDTVVRLEGHNMIINAAGKQHTIKFEQLKFVSNDYLVSTKANVYPNSYRVSWGNNDFRDFAIIPMFKTHEAS